MARLIFLPWVGRHYASGGMLGRRVLIVAEAHDRWPRRIPLTRLVTRECIRGQMSGAATARYWTNLVTAFINREPALPEKCAFWDSVAFATLVEHEAGAGPRAARSPAAWARARRRFGQLLDRYRPDFVAVLGLRLWRHLPDSGRPGPLVPGAPEPQTWRYHHPGGEALAFAMRHPTGGFSGREWHRHVSRALALAPFNRASTAS